jgi:peptide/nickel transport system substrate-binding protein
VRAWVTSKDRVVLEAFEDYWDRRYPKVKRVVFENKLIGDRKEAMRLCRETEGEVDIVSDIRPLDTLKVAESPFAKVVKSRDITWFRGIFNLRKKESKWRDIRLRKALTYSVNREELWKYAAKGNAYSLGGIIPEGAFGHNPNVKPYTYDTTRAKTLLAEAGYPDGFELKIIALERRKLETQIISKMLERVGLRVTFEILPEPQFWSKVVISVLDKPPEEQEWDIHLYNVEDASGKNVLLLPWNFIEETGIRWIEYDPSYEKMWEELKTTVDPEAQEEKIRQMVQYLHDQVYALNIYTPITLYAVNKEVNFVPTKYVTLNLRYTSVTDNHWSLRGQSE